MIKYMLELPAVLSLLQEKMRIPVFVGLRTNDLFVDRITILEYCREKYHGSLRVSVNEARSRLTKSS